MHDQWFVLPVVLTLFGIAVAWGFFFEQCRKLSFKKSMCVILASYIVLNAFCYFKAQQFQKEDEEYKAEQLRNSIQSR